MRAGAIGGPESVTGYAQCVRPTTGGSIVCWAEWGCASGSSIKRRSVPAAGAELQASDLYVPVPASVKTRDPHASY